MINPKLEENEGGGANDDGIHQSTDAIVLKKDVQFS